MDSRTLIRLMEQKGWTLNRVKGSHHIFTHPEYGYSIPVPHPKKDLAPGTLHQILKKAGLK